MKLKKNNLNLSQILFNANIENCINLPKVLKYQ